MVHIEIEPIKAYVNEFVLYNGEKQGIVPCKIFAVSFYQGESITFGIELDEGSVFFYVPPQMISLNKEFEFKLNELVYHNCPSSIVTANKFKFLEEKNLKVYIKQREKWFNAKYLLTIDWYEGNDLLHMIIIDNKQIAFLPSHKIKFDGEEKFLPFKKMKFEWIV